MHGCNVFVCSWGPKQVMVLKGTLVAFCPFKTKVLITDKTTLENSWIKLNYLKFSVSRQDWIVCYRNVTLRNVNTFDPGFVQHAKNMKCWLSTEEMKWAQCIFLFLQDRFQNSSFLCRSRCGFDFIYAKFWCCFSFFWTHFSTQPDCS